MIKKKKGCHYFFQYVYRSSKYERTCETKTFYSKSRKIYERDSKYINYEKITFSRNNHENSRNTRDKQMNYCVKGLPRTKRPILEKLNFEPATDNETFRQSVKPLMICLKIANCRRIVWVCLTILWGWYLKGETLSILTLVLLLKIYLDNLKCRNGPVELVFINAIPISTF